MMAGRYGDATYKAETLIRPDILMAILSQGYAVLWMDIDIVWLKNPLPIFPVVTNPNEVSVLVHTQMVEVFQGV